MNSRDMQHRGLGACEVSVLDHFTVRCFPHELPRLEAFYRTVLGLQPGPRPNFPFEGHWMHSGGKALVHLAAALSGPASPASATALAGGFDHVSFRAQHLDEVRQRLIGLGVPFEELPVPGWPLHQIFLRDPCGTKLELTFEVVA